VILKRRASLGVIVGAVVGMLTVGPAALPAQAAPLSSSLKLSLIGIDEHNGILIAWDRDVHQFRISQDWGQSWSAPKGAPVSNFCPGRASAVYYDGDLYVAGREGCTGVEKVWRTRVETGNTPFRFIHVFTGPAGSSPLQTDLAAGHGYLWLGTYGNPQPGPQIWRYNGVTWQKVWQGTTCKHVHAVAADPYHPGTVFATIGDGCGKVLLRSTDDGASWDSVVPSRDPNGCLTQSVQISFDAKYVYLGGDGNCKTAWAYARGSSALKPAGTNWHFDLPVPGLPNAQWLSNAYFGAVDPATGHYYAASGPGSKWGTKMGMFYLGQAGGTYSVFAGPSPVGLAAKVFIAHGHVWCNNQHFPLKP
jgi:hypothetical protein